MRATLSANIAMVRYCQTTTQRDQSFKANIASCISDTAEANTSSSHPSFSEYTDTFANDAALDGASRLGLLVC